MPNKRSSRGPAGGALGQKEAKEQLCHTEVRITSRQRAGAPLRVVHAHQLRVTIGQCVQDLETISKCCDPADVANRVEHLPLR